MGILPEYFSTIQEGIDAAEYGDTILVADGEYRAKSRDGYGLDFRGKAITVKSVNGP